MDKARCALLLGQVPSAFPLPEDEGQARVGRKEEAMRGNAPRFAKSCSAGCPPRGCTTGGHRAVSYSTRVDAPGGNGERKQIRLSAATESELRKLISKHRVTVDEGSFVARS